MQKKFFDKNLTFLHDKSPKDTRIEGLYVNIVKTTNDIPTANIILNGEELKAFPLKRAIG
jgi:hypothetical protein